MLRPRRLEREIDPGPVQIQARKVHFDLAGRPLQWIPGHPVASNVFNVLNLVVPAAERWFVATFNEALPLVKDARLADDMRGFIGQESTHADTHERARHDHLIGNGVDPKPIRDQLVRAMLLAVVVIAIMQRPGSYLMKADPQADSSWWKLQRHGYLDAKVGLLPKLGKLLGSNTFTYFRPGFSPEAVGSTAQAVAYLANSPAARAAQL